MSKIKKLKQNVYDASLDRMRDIYESYDDVFVMFSGGKDSTAVLTVALEIAEEKNKLPVKVVFIDEEVIHPTTVEYVARISKNPNIDLSWVCLPFKHRNACSNEQPYWYCWNPEEKDLWVRELPENAIIEDEDFKFGMSYVDWMQVKHNKKNTIRVLGIRAQESLRRLRMFSNKPKGKVVYTAESINTVDLQNGTKLNCLTFNGYPIYDWMSEDVWRLVNIKQLDYNRTYDFFNKTKLYNKLSGQRVSQPFGEEPLRNLALYSECFPDMWAKMIKRVKGVNSAKLYSNTELWGVRKDGKPEHLTWKAFLHICLSNYKDKYLHKVKTNINNAIKIHYRITDEPLPEEIPHILSGCSYKYLCKLVIKGDFKGRTVGMMNRNSEKERDKRGITIENARANHGR